MINIYWKTGIAEEAINAVIEGAKKFERIISVPESEVVVRGADRTVNEYARGIHRINGMFDAGTMNNWLSSMNPKEINVFLADEPICNEDGSYCLGLTRGICTVVSTKSVRNMSSLAPLVMHEIGHAHGMTNGERPYVTHIQGYHCTQPNCLMQQSFGVDAFERRLPASRKNGWFCKTCVEWAKICNARKGWYQTKNTAPNLPPRRPCLPPRHPDLTPRRRSLPPRRVGLRPLPPRVEPN